MPATEKISSLRMITELVRMADDPILFDLMCRIVDESRAAVKKPQPTVTLSGYTPRNMRLAAAEAAPRESPAEAPSSAPNGLTQAVLDCCRKMATDITIAKVVDRMDSEGYKFVAKLPKVAVADVIRRYTPSKLKLTEQGTGNSPSIYTWVGEE